MTMRLHRSWSRSLRKTMKGLSGVALLFALLALSTPARAALVTFDFEEYAGGAYGGASGYSSGALVANGFVLDPGAVDWAPDAQGWIGHYHIAEPTQLGWSADNGTNFFAFDYFFDNSRLNIYALSGAIFGVQRFDLAEALTSICHSSGPPIAIEHRCGVTFAGYLAGGGTISQTVTLDGTADGAGPLIDFETFNFDGRWNRLTMFSVLASDMYLNPGLDNLVLRTVPAPATLTLFGIGLAGLGIARRCIKISRRRR